MAYSFKHLNGTTIVGNTTIKFKHISKVIESILDGLLDDNGVQLASWAELTNIYGLDVSVGSSADETNTSSLLYVYNNNPELSTATQLIVPDVEIAPCASAFKNCTFLKNVEFYTTTNWFNTIAESTFYGCTALEKVKLPKLILSIGNNAFYGCSNLENLTAEGVKELGSGCFYKVSGNINLPNTIENVAASPFTPPTSENLSLTYNIYLYYSDSDEVLFATDNFLSIGSSKKTFTYNIYTDNSNLKDSLSAKADQYTLVNMYHLDGREWLEQEDIELPEGVPDNLTGYRIDVPDGWTAPSSYGQYNIIGDIDNSSLSNDDSYNFLVGYTKLSTSQVDSIAFKKDNAVLNTYTKKLSSDGGFCFIINGGADVSNKTLIKWFAENNAVFTKLISFTLELTAGIPSECQAEEGMTWEQWVNSSYNTGNNFNFDGDFSQYVHYNGEYYIHYNEYPVESVETIIANRKYSLKQISLEGGSID